MQQRKGTLESEDYPGFYHVEGIERLVVSEDAKFIDIRANYCLLHKVESWGYPAVNIMGMGTQLVHRLMALTFLVCPGNPDDFEVNHIDGNKLNNRISNLEWNTPSQNATHAYMTGLRTDNRPVKLKDLRTGDIEQFYSLQACARHLRVNAEKLHRHINSSLLYPLNDVFTVAYDGQPFKSLTSDDIGKRPKNNGRDVVLIGKDQKYLFPSLSAAARFTGTSTYKLAKLIGEGFSEQINGFSICYLDEYTGDRDFEEPVKQKPIKTPKRKPKPIIVKNPITEQAEHWDSSEEFCRCHGVKKNTFQKAINKTGNWKGYRVEYID